eukprot:TRINITY_DN4348_c1_g2_i3.p2 TRINITY_DN4348_c1_g2~~TRINITY_DN4348_c1_g2_i3.p2  ORF type:complete len:171 (-),score=8.28 TRINITY_DN4348_c1_g2_i3:177-689(-)
MNGAIINGRPCVSSGQTLGVKAQRFRGHTSPHIPMRIRQQIHRTLELKTSSTFLHICQPCLVIIYGIIDTFMLQFNVLSLAGLCVCNILSLAGLCVFSISMFLKRLVFWFKLKFKSFLDLYSTGGTTRIRAPLYRVPFVLDTKFSNCLDKYRCPIINFLRCLVSILLDFI